MSRYATATRTRYTRTLLSKRGNGSRRIFKISTDYCTAIRGVA